MRVIYLTKYSINGASSRLRSYQYFPLLEKENINVTVSPFFNEKYLKNLYSGKKTSVVQLLNFYVVRFFTLFTLFKYDKVVIEKELFPYFFSWFEKILSVFNIKYIVDYDDAIFHNYDLNPNKLIAFFLKNKIYNVMKYSDCVIAGNDYLALKAKQSGARKVVLLPTAINLDKYRIKEDSKNKTVVIGWIGTPSTFKYIKKFETIFLKLKNIYDIELHIVGAKKDGQCCKEIKFFDWSEESEVDLISKFDIGVMPLENTPWELGKCSYKLIQYMGCGIPVIASSVGMNKIVVVNNVNGFLVNNDYDWIQKLSKLIIDKDLRANQGAIGRIMVAEKFCLHNNISTLLTLIKDEKEVVNKSYTTIKTPITIEELNILN
ncbi:glycosyltransferase [Flavobacterium sp. SUN052]|uniref:glycosyltransferase n=1 Tax=Flavobacterium sp. SUN052 TaxID=3002441 RepID=UPI00237EBB74|nr:glycosyltransferase [Flavobacterium sp. SUN052]MEC4005494.1 glycosyltransferase [Flavobacterium sp. SUN052]